MKLVYVSPSNIEGSGIFAMENFKEKDIIGVSHALYDDIWYTVYPLGVYYNHSFNPNCRVETKDNINLFLAKRDIIVDEELTIDYTKQLYLEQPEEYWIMK